VVAELNDSTVIDHFTCVSHAVLERGDNFHDQLLSTAEMAIFMDQDREDVADVTSELQQANFNYIRRMSMMKMQHVEQVGR
jgi:hypothetical protein